MSYEQHNTILTSSFIYMPVFAALVGFKVALYRLLQAPAGGKVAPAGSKVLTMTSSFLLYMPVFAALAGGKVPPGGAIFLVSTFFFAQNLGNNLKKSNFMLCPFLTSKLINSYIFVCQNVRPVHLP
jgi:hypothetical protein